MRIQSIKQKHIRSWTARYRSVVANINSTFVLDLALSTNYASECVVEHLANTEFAVTAIDSYSKIIRCNLSDFPAECFAVSIPDINSNAYVYAIKSRPKKIVIYLSSPLGSTF